MKKYTVGDKLIFENDKDKTLEVLEVFDRYCITINQKHTVRMYSWERLKELGYSLIEIEIPPNPTILIVWSDRNIKRVRVSSGRMNEKGNILVFEYGKFSGNVSPYKYWKLVNETKSLCGNCDEVTESVSMGFTCGSCFSEK